MRFQRKGGLCVADTFVKDAIYPSIDSAFSQKQNVNKYEQIIASFIDKNHELLSDIGPMKIILFTDNERNQIYNLVDVTPSQVKAAKNKSKDIKSDGLNLADPFKSLMTMVVRFFSLKKDQQMVRLSTLYLGLSLYPSLFSKYWKYPPNEKIMRYTINNLSNKYKIKQFGTLLATLDDICYGAYELHKDIIDKGDDKAIPLFVLSMQTRLNSFLKKICNEWNNNYKSGKYLEEEFESNEEDNYREAESTIYAVSKIIDNVSMRLIIDGPPMKIITLTANNNQVSVNELRNYLNTMINNENRDEIRKIIEHILMLFLYDSHHSSRDINTDEFLIYCLDTYKRSNTTDQNIVAIKKILDGWLERLDVYKKTQRVATINSFRRALFMFFVLTIQYYNT